MLVILTFEIRKYGIVYLKNKEVREENKKIRLELNSLNEKYHELIMINNELVLDNNQLTLHKNEIINSKKANILSDKKINKYELEYQMLIELYNQMNIEFNKKNVLIEKLRAKMILFDLFIEINNKYRKYHGNESDNRKMISNYIYKLFFDIEQGLSKYYNEKIKLRTTILFPKIENLDLLKEYLRVYAYFEIGNVSIYDVEFYIGEDLEKRKEKSGVAGIAYIEKRVVYAQFSMSNDKPIKKNPDAQHHIFLPIEQEEKGILEYLMIYAQYINVSDKLNGVICIDSMKNDLFDDKNLVRYFNEFVFYNIEQFLGRYADDIMNGW